MGRNSKLFLWAMILPFLVSSVVAQDAPVAAPAAPTLWSFLGIPQGARKVHGALFNTKGKRPNLEQKPALKAIGDPENLKSKNDAIKQAAKVKQEEDLKPQKIKAIKYLASIGCGCYDKDDEITKALIASAEDCTEEVRLTTMDELYKISCGKCCSKCGMTCCCKEAMLKKLAEIAYQKDETGCYIEPSQRVREGAIKVLKSCCPSPIPPMLEPEKPKKKDEPVVPVPKSKKDEVEPEKAKSDKEEVDSEKSSSEDSEKDDAADKGEKPEADSESASDKAAEDKMDKDDADKDSEGDKPESDELPAKPPKIDKEKVTLRLTDLPHPQVLWPEDLPLDPRRPAAIANPDIPLTSSPNPAGGVVIGFDPKVRLAYVHFEDPETIAPLGSSVYLKVDPTRGTGYRGQWKVVSTARGRANLLPVDQEDTRMILPGDHVMFGLPPVSVAPVGFNR